MILDPEIWGPHYWFVLNTMAFNYPIKPNEVIKKKYYSFYNNLPLFMPIPEIGNDFAKLLNKYPVNIYLDSRKSLLRWTHFIHNKINTNLGKPNIDFDVFLTNYYNLYKPKTSKNIQQREIRQRYAYLILIVFIIIVLILLYNK